MIKFTLKKNSNKKGKLHPTTYSKNFGIARLNLEQNRLEDKVQYIWALTNTTKPI
ncbi:MAG: hypothetical protein HC811_03360 [Flammeovirgaceae bacterium]|nr:hypothetical protein [Flammeovirgaceae bacterium]